MELTKRDNILISIISCLFFVQVIHGMLDQLGVVDYTVFTDYWLPVSFFVLFVWSWHIMVLSAIEIVSGQFSWEMPSYTLFCIISWISLFTLVMYTRGMKIMPRIAYLYFIPALVMSLAYLHCIPFH